MSPFAPITPFLPPRPPTSLGPRTRVHITGHADEPTVRTALTRAWRRHGQPLTVVVTPTGTPTERIAQAWASEHAFAGITTETRRVTLAASSGEVLAVDDVPPCAGCVSPLCPDCTR